MFQLRRILLSGLVALLMVGMVTANDVEGSVSDTVFPIGGFIGTYTDGKCLDSDGWTCIRIWIDFRIPALL